MRRLRVDEAVEISDWILDRDTASSIAFGRNLPVELGTAAQCYSDGGKAAKNHEGAVRQWGSEAVGQ